MSSPKSLKKKTPEKKKKDLGHAFRLGVREQNNDTFRKKCKSIKPNQRHTPNQSVKCNISDLYR